MSERILQVPLYACQESKICPKKALLHAISLSPGGPHDLVFAYMSKSGLTPITQSEFTRFFRTYLSLAGYDGSVFLDIAYVVEVLLMHSRKGSLESWLRITETGSLRPTSST